MSRRNKSKPINPIRAAFLEAVQMIEEGETLKLRALP
jgi:hypothetical protein